MLERLYKLLGLKNRSLENKTARQNPKRKASITSARIGELGEHKIDIQLAQLPGNAKCISDVMVRNGKSRTGYSQIDHVVITPYAIFIIETKNYNGTIKGNRYGEKWTVNGKFQMYNPIKQNYGHVQAVEAVLSCVVPLRFVSLVTFTMRARFSIDPELRKIESDQLVIYDVELSEYISRKINRIKATTSSQVRPLTAEEIDTLYRQIQAANVTDQAIRAEHVRNAQSR